MSDILMAGGCACGAVRYEVYDAPEFMMHCQCRTCQRGSGTGHSSILMVSASAFHLTGKLQRYRSTADSEARTTRGFCPICGCPIVNETSRFPDNRYIHAASLDEPDKFAPTMVVWQSAGQHWDHIDPALRDIQQG